MIHFPLSRFPLCRSRWTRIRAVPILAAAALLSAGSLAALPAAAKLTDPAGEADAAVVAEMRIPLVRRDDYLRRDLSDSASRIRVDGKLDEPAWRGLAVHEDFRVIEPDTLEPGELPTRVRMFYTARGLYVGAEMAQDSDTLVEHLTGRDRGGLNRDFFAVTLDTSGEGRYGFWFQVALGNSISDGTLLPPRNYSDSWDGAWRGATARTPEGWTAEFFIPWSAVRIPEEDGARTLGVFLQRNIAYRNERHAWPPLARTQPQFMSAFRDLGLRDVSPKQQVRFTPYVSANHDRFAGGAVAPKVGADLLWKPSSGLQLATTLNPDFGNVEADDVVVNLSNYETFFPEKRLFFQEGQEIFVTNDRQGGELSLLHTRRIGAPAVRPDAPEGFSLAAEDLGRPAELRAALKATGQKGLLRYGFLGVSEDDARFNAYRGGEHLALTQDGRDFGALRLLFEHTADGYKGIGLLSTAMRHPTRSAAVNAIDGKYISAGGRWRVGSQFIASDADGSAEDGVGGFLDVRYSPRRGMMHFASFDAFDDSIQINDMGYLRRNDFRRVRYRMLLSKSRVGGFRDTRTFLRAGRAWNGAGQTIGAEIALNQMLMLNNFSQIRIGAALRPARYDDRGSFGNGTFRVEDTWSAELQYRSDTSRRISYSLRHDWRTENTGDGTYRRMEGSVRWRPTDRMTMGLGMQYVDRESWLLHQSDGRFTAFAANELRPNFDLNYFFSARQQLRMAFQWVAVSADERRFYALREGSTQLHPVERQAGAASDDFAISRMNMQVRYRWELAPLSDLFLVYTKSASLPFQDMADTGFGTMFSDTFAQTTGENLVLKLRYRFGS